MVKILCTWAIELTMEWGLNSLGNHWREENIWGKQPEIFILEIIVTFLISWNWQGNTELLQGTWLLNQISFDSKHGKLVWSLSSFLLCPLCKFPVSLFSILLDRFSFLIVGEQLGHSLNWWLGTWWRVVVGLGSTGRMFALVLPKWIRVHPR